LGLDTVEEKPNLNGGNIDILGTNFSTESSSSTSPNIKIPYTVKAYKINLNLSRKF
jgi:hypothetical protein